jgi:hypothetical protein
VQFLLRNNGDAPAVDVDVRGKLFAIDFPSSTRQQWKDAETALCQRFRTQHDQATKFAVYPNKPIQQTLGVDLHQIYLDEAVNLSKHGLLGPVNLGGEIPVSLILCIDYRTPDAPAHHQSQYALQFTIPDERSQTGKNSFLAFFFGFKPEGSYPNAHVIYFDENID